MTTLYPSVSLYPYPTVYPGVLVGTPVAGSPPIVSAVAAYLRARTRTQGGEEIGTFMPAAKWTDGSGKGTRPTAEQVVTLYNENLPLLLTPFGTIPDAPGPDPDAWRKAVDKLVALGVALEVELSYFPEQVATGRSPYPQLLALFESRQKLLRSLLGLDDIDTPGLDRGYGYPSYGGFPTTAIGMETPW